MSKPSERNYGHSAYARLLAFAKNNRLDFTFALQRYAMERLLYRMSKSIYADKFILKGASLFLVWKGHSFRVTKDADFLAFGFLNEDSLASIFKEIVSIPGCEDDGLGFEPDSIRAAPIREEQEYGGIRVTLTALLHNARIPLQIDVGFGDAVTPAPEIVTYPSALGYPAAHLRAYTRYTVVAEKLEAMVQLGIADSRMKDFYDIWLMSRLFDFHLVTLCSAIQDTFKRRKTDLPKTAPMALTEEFWGDAQKRTQWNAFLRKSKPEGAESDFEKIVTAIADFLLPALQAIQAEEMLNRHWESGGPWREVKGKDRARPAPRE
ncbi:MAG: nucleotidyl transferase AbiEii/AbiGii toxin family protein [Chitinivibrionales bacterium]|nr:nucleotidyl transferase AbiEii/AbiGii toxin family protein [Chitinivibrionales bacterium]